jgi:hypothetical protein
MKLSTDETAAKAEVHRQLAPQAIASNREARAAMIASGQTPPPALDTKTRLDAAKSHLGDIEMARKLHSSKMEKIRKSVRIRRRPPD